MCVICCDGCIIRTTITANSTTHASLSPKSRTRPLWLSRPVSDSSSSFHQIIEVKVLPWHLICPGTNVPASQLYRKGAYVFKGTEPSLPQKIPLENVQQGSQHSRMLQRSSVQYSCVRLSCNHQQTLANASILALFCTTHMTLFLSFWSAWTCNTGNYLHPSSDARFWGQGKRKALYFICFIFKRWYLFSQSFIN